MAGLNIPQSIVDSRQPLDRSSFERVREAEFRPGYTLDGIQLLQEKAQNEHNLKQLYRGRAPYELLQNADDAGAKRAAFILLPNGLAFAHNGHWFTVENFRSLASKWSDKHPDRCIGHKGLGFRSVLDITPSPFLMKVDDGEFFCIKFTWHTNHCHIQQTLQKDSKIRAIFQNWPRARQKACPVMHIPNVAKKANLDAGEIIFNRLCHERGSRRHTTMFWFPASDSEIDPEVLRQLGPSPLTSSGAGRQRLCDFLEREVNVLLPFLNSLESVEVYDDATLIAEAKVSPRDEASNAGELTVATTVNGHTLDATFFQMRFDFPIQPDVRRLDATLDALREMNRASIVLSARLRDGQPSSDDDAYFHVYFPTEERTGLGFVIHGDFYVKPDRTRLMPSGYNEWLLKCAARKAADEFLTELLARYRPSRVFDSLSPTMAGGDKCAAFFLAQFKACLSERTAPFIPGASVEGEGNGGLLPKQEAIVPPNVDSSGFWNLHFGSHVADVVQGAKAFLDPAEDCAGTRTFFDLASVAALDVNRFFAFAEVCAKGTLPPEWWYECYSYMAADPTLSSKPLAFFAGRRLLPISPDAVIAVPAGDALTVCLAPGGTSEVPSVPRAFSSSFELLDSSLAVLLQEGTATVLRWVREHLGIVRFQASEVLPKAIASVGKAVFGGVERLTVAELGDAWRFIKAIVGTAKEQAQEFWNDLGRFPLPLSAPAQDYVLLPTDLVPATLAYWPDELLSDADCLRGVPRLRRVDGRFLTHLSAADNDAAYEWREFFRRIGVSRGPKLLKYARLAVGDVPVPFEEGAIDNLTSASFCGERQIDVNRAVINLLRSQGLWDSLVAAAKKGCSHPFTPVLQSLTVIEGLSECGELACQQYDEGDSSWHKRLSSLIGQLPQYRPDPANQLAFCRGSGGHHYPIPSYVTEQLKTCRWLPSTIGPVSISEAFCRLSTRRLISAGRSEDELGDQLLPYVVVNALDEQSTLQQLGVEPLEDADSATPSALVRALSLLGDRLDTDWGHQEIAGVPGRWRLVRGAIQEIYRCLNQTDVPAPGWMGTKLAARVGGTIEFREPPLYYAEPGSPVEEAFGAALPLLDVDRPHPTLFARLGIVRLDDEANVSEHFLGIESAIAASHIQDEIVSQLAPYLFASVLAKSDNPKQRERLVRRIRESFAVKLAEELNVEFSLKVPPYSSATVVFPRFYLHRTVVPRLGAIEEAQFTLYIGGMNRKSILDLDGDALGEVLSSVFMDNVSRELAGLFPRIASRYKMVGGDKQEMEEFLWRHLRISKEALDLARASITGEVDVPLPPATPPPPPPKFVQGHQAKTATQLQDGFQQAVNDKAAALVDQFAAGAVKGGDRPTGEHGRQDGGGRGRVTPEQENQGRIGEEEVKRRLEQSEGWIVRLEDGLSVLRLIADRRDDGCGYDFLCSLDKRQVKLEVKTFTYNGRIVVTGRELQEAAASKDDYYLLGVLYENRPASEWGTFLLPNPAEALLLEGALDLEATVTVAPGALFRFPQETTH